MEDLHLGNYQTITLCDNYKYFAVTIGKDGWDEKEIPERIGQGRKAIKWPNGRWWHKEISKKTKYHVHNTIIKINVLYKSEVQRWTKAGKMIATLQTDTLGRSRRISQMERIPNEINK